MKKTILVFTAALCGLFAVNIGERAADVSIGGKDGGKLDGRVWHSSEMRGKTTVLFYIDPDKKDLNDAFGKRLKAAKFAKNSFHTFVVINLAATWMPNALIEVALKQKQKQFKETTYIKDKHKVLVKKWHLPDDAYDIVIFDKHGRCLYTHTGKVTPKESEKIITLIKKSLRRF